MKTLLTLIFAVISIGIQAKCGGNSFEAWPSQKHILQSSQFVLEGYGGFEKILANADSSHTVYLVNEQERIPLTKLRTYHGDMRLVQVMYKPSTPLMTGHHYSLEIDNLSELEKIHLLRYNDLLDKQEPYEWYIMEGDDTTKPAFINPPTMIDKEVLWFGYGPSIHVTFNMEVADEHEVWIETMLTEIETQSTSVYLIPVKNNQVRVGHGMCSGAFQFHKDRGYRVVFAPIDSSGNKSDQESPGVEFSSPLKK